MSFWCLPRHKASHYLSSLMPYLLQVPLSLQVYKICWIHLINLIKWKWGLSPHHCRAQDDEEGRHVLNIKHQWNSSNTFSLAWICVVYWITSIMTIKWILCCLWPFTELAFLARAAQPDPKCSEVSGETQHLKQTELCWSKARTGNSEET